MTWTFPLREGVLVSYDDWEARKLKRLWSWLADKPEGLQGFLIVTISSIIAIAFSLLLAFVTWELFAEEWLN